MSPRKVLLKPLCVKWVGWQKHTVDTLVTEYNRGVNPSVYISRASPLRVESDNLPHQPKGGLMEQPVTHREFKNELRHYATEAFVWKVVGGGIVAGATILSIIIGLFP